MRKDRSKAEQLRRAGKSYKEINRKLGIPIATLSDWFRNTPWSIEIKNRLAGEESLANPNKLQLMVAATKKKFAKLHEEYRLEAISEFPNLKNNPLFIAGVMLYWGEGDKSVKNGQVRISNTDPGIIKTFYFFLKLLGMSEEKIALHLLLYPDLVDSVQKNMWSKVLGLPISKFRKSTTIVGRHPTKRNSFGVCIIYLSSRKLKEKIIKWIELSQIHLNSFALTNTPE